MASRETIPADLAESIERQTGASITQVIPRGGGGASRQGVEVCVQHADGREQRGYLSFDTRAGDPSRLSFFKREVAILKALSGPGLVSGIAVPTYIASEPSHLALFTEFVSGIERFEKADDPSGLARDYLAQLAALHRIDASSLALDGFGDPSLAPSQRISEQLALWRHELLQSNPDPILILALQWLESNIPEDRRPSVVLHGDAGPGNFLHRNSKVAALLDWELSHLGDPMEDLAQCWVRSLVQPFVPMREAFAAYEAAGGAKVDIDCVRYHRLYFQMSFMIPGHIAAQKGTKTAMLGITLMFGALHRRVVVESLAELSGTSVAHFEIPDIPVPEADGMFETALADIKDDILPGITDQHAATKAKSLARLVKYWRARDRFGSIFDRLEIDEISSIVGHDAEALVAARSAFAAAIGSGATDFATGLQLCHNRVTRETILMRDVMGVLATSSFAPLDG